MVPLLPNIVRMEMSMISKCVMHPNIVPVWKASRISLFIMQKGESVRVKDVGKVVERFAPLTIERKDRERIVTVSAVISGAPLGDVVAAGNKIIDKMELPGK